MVSEVTKSATARTGSAAAFGRLASAGHVSCDIGKMLRALFSPGNPEYSHRSATDAWVAVLVR
jgi:hypothetical protein